MKMVSNMINLGLNRKISNVLSKNLNDPESDIYKEISSIAGETTESDSSVNTVRKIIEDGKNQITRFYDDTLVGVSNDFFNGFDNLEEIYLLKATDFDLGEDNRLSFFVNCPKLKKLMLPAIYSEDKGHEQYIEFDNRLADLPVEILLFSGSLDNGGMFDGYPVLNSLDTLILTSCDIIGYGGLSGNRFPNLHNLILPQKSIVGFSQGLSSLNYFENVYVPNIMIKEYNDNGATQVKPLSALPDNLKHELKLCGIDTEDEDNTIKSFVDEEITELDDCVFRNYYNLEYVNLPNCTKMGDGCFIGCRSLKTLLLPKVTEITSYSLPFQAWIETNLEVLDLSSCDNNLFDSDDNLYYQGNGLHLSSSFLSKLKILSYGINGLADGYGDLGWNQLDILILPNFTFLGMDNSCKANNIILPSEHIIEIKRTSSTSGPYYRGYIEGTMYVNDNLLNTYQNHESWCDKYNDGEILPISQLPQEIREELELCGIEI